LDSYGKFSKNTVIMIIEISQLYFFMGATLALLLVPGPAVLYITARSANQGRLAGLVSVLAIETANFLQADAVTDENGVFTLHDMPAPVFFVHIDGSTATNAPPGTVYANAGTDIIVGIIGGVVGGFLAGQLFGVPNAVNGTNVGSIVVAFLGAIAAIAIVRALPGRSPL